MPRASRESHCALPSGQASAAVSHCAASAIQGSHGAAFLRKSPILCAGAVETTAKPSFSNKVIRAYLYVYDDGAHKIKIPVAGWFGCMFAALR